MKNNFGKEKSRYKVSFEMEIEKSFYINRFKNGEDCIVQSLKNSSKNTGRKITRIKVFEIIKEAV